MQLKGEHKRFQPEDCVEVNSWKTCEQSVAGTYFAVLETLPVGLNPQRLCLPGCTCQNQRWQPAGWSRLENLVRNLY